MLKHKLSKPVFFLLCSLPMLWIISAAFIGGLGANPVEKVTHLSGDWALRLLILTLALTPLKQLTGKVQFIRFRRMAGLFVYFYALVHFTIWFVADHSLDFVSMYQDIIKRPYITFGFFAFLLLTPLAITSNQWSMRKLGKRWKTLHKLVYPILILAVLHFIWLVKADFLEPIIYAVVAAILLGFRIKPLKNNFLQRLQFNQSSV
jgi:methionine sulfoxide reductase heme-binding subunit